MKLNALAVCAVLSAGCEAGADETDFYLPTAPTVPSQQFVDCVSVESPGLEIVTGRGTWLVDYPVTFRNNCSHAVYLSFQACLSLDEEVQPGGTNDTDVYMAAGATHFQNMGGHNGPLPSPTAAINLVWYACTMRGCPRPERDCP